jgi:NDP-sugar pyrophosphorylase family protein
MNESPQMTIETDSSLIVGRQALVGVVLAAGLGTRLWPLTDVLPKALCPVNNEPLVDGAIRRVRAVAEHIAVNVNAHRDQMTEHLERHPDLELSIELPVALGTAGALGRLRSWIDGRDVLVHNSDSWHNADLAKYLVDGWDGNSMRLLVVPSPRASDFGHTTYAGVCLLPWAEISKLTEQPSGLYEVLWRNAESEGRLELITYDGPWFDCGSPSTYLAANLSASNGQTVIGKGASIEGSAIRSVIWPGAVVRRGERLVEVIRASETLTVDASQGQRR